MVFFQGGAYIREKAAVPFKITPMEFLHPETVEMEHAQGDLALQHALDKRAGGGLIVVGGERGGQPQPERPGRRQGGPAGEPGVLPENLFGAGALEKIVADSFTWHGKTHILYLFAAYLKRSVVGTVHQHAVPLAGKIERHVFIGCL